MNTLSEALLAEIMDCGTSDLSIINESNADINDYIANTSKGMISLQNFTEYLVKNANEILRNTWDREKDNIIFELEEIEKMIIADLGDRYDPDSPQDRDEEALYFFRHNAQNVIHNGLRLDYNNLATIISIPYADLLDEYGLLDNANKYIGFTSIRSANQK